MKGSHDLASRTILNIDFKFSRNWLTVIKYTNKGDIRHKFSDKLVQTLDSPSVKDLFGSHIGDYILILVTN